MNNIWLKQIGYWLLTLVFLVVVINQIQKKNTPVIATMSYSNLMKNVKSGKIKRVTLHEGNIYIHCMVKDEHIEEKIAVLNAQLKIAGDEVSRRELAKEIEALQNKLTYRFYLPTRVQTWEFMQFLSNNNIEVQAFPEVRPNVFIATIHNLLFKFLDLIIIWFIFRQILGGGRSISSITKSRLKTKGEKIKTTFKDVAGIHEAKEEVKEIVDFLRHARKFKKTGATIPKGILLVGPPGCGKTLLAKAIAGESNASFFFISGSEFVELFVGVGASRVREMFASVKKKLPAILFIDEIDAVGGKRDGKFKMNTNEEREQTLNQLLVEMDGFEDSKGNLIVLGATNRMEVLDDALLRPGRFDRHVFISLPDVQGREEILKIHASKINMAPDVDLSLIARGTPGMSGADLRGLINEAALYAGRMEKDMVTIEDIDYAKDKLILGMAYPSLMDEKEKRTTATHESGHAIVGFLMEEQDPIYKVTILPRGRSLGSTHFLPEKDQHSYTKKQLEAKIATLMGGRIAEMLIYGADQVTSGASEDICMATDIAKNMVERWGLSDCGPLSYTGMQTEFGVKGYSEATAIRIDTAVASIIDRNYKLAEKTLKDNLHILKNMANELIEHETLNKEQIEVIIQKGLKQKPAVH